MKNKKLRRTATKHATRISSARLEKMISDATVDCYNESEAAGGLFCMLEQNLAVPFATTVLELEIVVERVDLNDADEIVAVCGRGDSRQRIPILDLPLPDPRPEGAEWIDAYRRWARRK